MVGVYVVHQRPVVHHEARRLPSSAVPHRIMMQRKDVNARVARRREGHIGRRASEERTRRRRQLEQEAVVVGRGEVQSGDVRRTLGRGRVCKAVDPDLAAVLERRDHVCPWREEGKVPNTFRSLVLLNELRNQNKE